MEIEKWASVKGYEGIYEVSSFGRIKSLERLIPVDDRFERRIGEKIIKQAKTGGYPCVALRKRKKAKTFYTHRLVAEAFIPNLKNKPQVNHKDGIKENNRVENLEWVSAQENTIHAFENNLCTKTNANKNGNLQGEKVSTSKLKEKDILFIRKNSRKNGGDFSNVQLAEIFGISSANVCLILKGRRWKHLI